MAISIRGSEEFLGSKEGLIGMEEEEEQRVEEELEEEEEELFEINLEAVDNFPPTQYYWESYVTATTNTLLANCLLPIADVSCAIPMVPEEEDDALAWPAAAGVVFVAEPLQNHGLGAFGWYIAREM